MKYTYDMGPVCYVPDPDRPWETGLGLNPCYYGRALPDMLSFEEHFLGHYGDMICGSVCDQISAGILKPGKGTYFVPEPDKASANSAYVFRMYFSRKDSSTVHFVAIVIAEMTIYAQLEEMQIQDQREEWYRVEGECDIGVEDHGMAVNSVRVYRREGNWTGQTLSTYLVPKLNKQQLNDEGERILRLYCPETLVEPKRVPAKLLAECIGLRVRYLPLASFDDDLGLLFFRDSIVEVVDWKTGETHSENVEAGTIVINARTVARDDHKIMTQVVIHECVHNMEHDLFYRFQRMYNEEISYLVCPSKIDASYNDPNNPVRWIEWQAREITRCIQMPASTTRIKVNELLRKYEARGFCSDRAWFFECVVKELAEFYGVSRHQARRRMIDLGYEEAQGVLNYVNGAYVPAFSFGSGKLGRYQTYTISFEDMVAEYTRNAKFREVLDLGHFVYVEGHLCLNHPKYVRQGRNGKLQLSEHGRAHVDECCMLFNVSRSGSTPKYVDGVLRSETPSVERKVTADDTETGKFLARSREMHEEARGTTQILCALPPIFSDTLVAHMKRRAITIEELEARTGISARKISDLRNDENARPVLRTVVTLCIGLQLEPELSDDLIRKSGASAKLVVEDTMYRIMLRSMYRSTVEECNAFLTAEGLTPLIKRNKIA